MGRRTTAIPVGIPAAAAAAVAAAVAAAATAVAAPIAVAAAVTLSLGSHLTRSKETRRSSCQRQRRGSQRERGKS
jgi:hypothetical protein